MRGVIYRKGEVRPLGWNVGCFEGDVGSSYTKVTVV